MLLGDIILQEDGSHLRAIAMRDHHLVPSLHQVRDRETGRVHIGALFLHGALLFRLQDSVSTKGDDNSLRHRHPPNRFGYLPGRNILIRSFDILQMLSFPGKDIRNFRHIFPGNNIARTMSFNRTGIIASSDIDFFHIGRSRRRQESSITRNKGDVVTHRQGRRLSHVQNKVVTTTPENLTTL